MKNNTIILTERHTHKISLETFHLLIAPYPDLRSKWGSFSVQTKEDIWEVLDRPLFVKITGKTTF